MYVSWAPLSTVSHHLFSSDLASSSFAPIGRQQLYVVIHQPFLYNVPHSPSSLKQGKKNRSYNLLIHFYTAIEKKNNLISHFQAF